jgi:hypothetical protein
MMTMAVLITPILRSLEQHSNHVRNNQLLNRLCLSLPILSKNFFFKNQPDKTNINHDFRRYVIGFFTTLAV